MEGSDGTCKDTEDTTMLVQIEEAKCDSRNLSYVTKLSPVRAVNGMGPGWKPSLCARVQKSMTDVQRSKSQQSASRVSTERSSDVYRSS